MPCRDYESDDWSSHSTAIEKYKAQANKLARIACKAMEALEENGIEDFLVLKDREVAEWWTAHKEADRKERERVAELERRKRIREEALAKLSTEEREVLGISTKAKRGRKVPVEDELLSELAETFYQTYKRK